MRRSPSIVPETDDREIYLVLDDFGGHLGRAWPEADEERTDRETVIIDLMDGQFSNPVRVVAFNTAEGWSRDVSEEIADELRQRLGTADREIPPDLEDFLDRHGGGRPVQLPLPLERPGLTESLMRRKPRPGDKAEHEAPEMASFTSRPTLRLLGWISILPCRYVDNRLGELIGSLGPFGGAYPCCRTSPGFMPSPVSE